MLKLSPVCDKAPSRRTPFGTAADLLWEKTKGGGKLRGGENQESPQQTKPKKGQFMNFSQGHSGTKVQCESCLFSQGKTPEFTKMGEIHELFVAGATPEKTYHKTPSQKRFWTPPPMIRFPPPFVFALLFSLEETGTDQANPTF